MIKIKDTKKELNNIFSKVRGKFYKDFNIGKLTFFKTGGNAEYLFIPKDIEDLIFFLKNKPEETNIFILGLGSNILIRDKGFNGVIIKLNNLNKVVVKDNFITAESMALDKSVAEIAKNNSLTGVEFLYTIPGSIGGAFAMNAGAYGKEFEQIFFSAEILDINGNIKNILHKDIFFSYRKTSVKGYNQVILLNTTLSLEKGNMLKIDETMKKMEENRWKTQPSVGIKTGGSTFKNPNGMKAWELIKHSCGNNLRVGGAKISDKHANFLENTGNATAKDIEELGNLIINKVKYKYSITLDWEVKIIGDYYV